MYIQLLQDQLPSQFGVLPEIVVSEWFLPKANNSRKTIPGQEQDVQGSGGFTIPGRALSPLRCVDVLGCLGACGEFGSVGGRLGLNDLRSLFYSMFL